MKPVPSILATILERKREEVEAAKARVPIERLLDQALAAPHEVRSLRAALARPRGAPVRVIAEIKRASPSAGPIRPGADPGEIATEYVAAGAHALSVLTDRDFFDGDLGFLGQVRAALGGRRVPLLRKDFLIDPYQVVEARVAGADAVLLIAAALDDRTLAELWTMARTLTLDALVEVHDEAEAERAAALGADIIGVNHRDLATFQMDMGLTARLAPRLRDAVLVAESGIKTRADVEAMAAAGAHAVLVGESLMRAPSPGEALKALLP